jgi:membrane protease YdiL (CAAX protease family)
VLLTAAHAVLIGHLYIPANLTVRSRGDDNYMHPTWRKTGLFVGFSLLALFLIGTIGAVWGALIYANLRTSPSVPWSLPAIIMVLYLMWQYLGGRGWPHSTTEARAALRRANPVSRLAFGWSMVAGLLATAALAGYWIIMFQLFRMPANRVLPERFTSSPILIVAIIIGASLVAPITEESAVRGYLQTVLEREFPPVTAISLSSLIFALAHITQGVAWPKLFIYFLVGVTFGSLAYFNNSILPVIPIHIAADLTFFLLVWPHDATRELVWQTGTNVWFWVHVTQAIGFTILSLLAFQRLRAASQGRRPNAEKANRVRTGY